MIDHEKLCAKISVLSVCSVVFSLSSLHGKWEETKTSPQRAQSTQRPTQRKKLLPIRTIDHQPRHPQHHKHQRITKFIVLSPSQKGSCPTTTVDKNIYKKSPAATSKKHLPMRNIPIHIFERHISRERTRNNERSVIYMSNEYIVEARGIHKIYDTGRVKVHALRGIDLTVRKGEMVGIMGPSGCGKTTMLNCLSGLDDLTEGKVHIENKLLNTMTDNEKTEYRAQRMGFIFQFFNLLPVLTAAENVELPLLVAGVKPAKARVRAVEMLELVGLGKHVNQKPAELSGGERQRVTISRSLVNRPALIWADEPTGNLDSETSKEIVDLIVDLNRKNKQTFIVVTHDPKVGQRMDRIVLMESGKITDDGRSQKSEQIKENIECIIQENGKCVEDESAA